MNSALEMFRRLAALDGLSESRGSKGIEFRIVDKVRQILTAARHRFAATPHEDLADELEDLLKRASLARPPVLDPDVYRAVVAVWEALGTSAAATEEAAIDALEQLKQSSRTA